MLNQKFWEKYSKVYDALSLLIPYQELLETICKELNIKKGEKILDAGCGTGNLTIKIKKMDGIVTALDNCSEALKRLQRKDSTIKTVVANLTEQLPFPNNYFDKIACNNVLYAMSTEERLRAIKELHRILKPNGKIVISNPMKEANPIKIYLWHIKKSIKTKGAKKTIKDIIKMFVPTIKIFYYNLWLRRKRKKIFLEQKQQVELLKQAGFVNISKTKFSYAKQNILNSAFK